MKVRVEFFKDTGKWYASDIVDIGDARLRRGDVYEAVCRNQRVVNNPRQFVVVVLDLPGEEDFCTRMFPPQAVSPESAEKERGCGGLGSYTCLCGGDVCACGNQGEIECYGCEDCDVE